jgi:hypothetical protein
MRLITFAAGVAVGYVLGSKAGRQAYERIKLQVSGLTHSDPVQQVAGDVKDLASKAASEAGDRVSGLLDKASDKMDEVSGKGSSTSGSGDAAPATSGS